MPSGAALTMGLDTREAHDTHTHMAMALANTSYSRSVNIEKHLDK